MYPAYWYLESGTREEFAMKKVNFCYLCNGRGQKEPCDLTMFLQNGLLFLNFYFEQKKLSFLLVYLYLNFSYFHFIIVSFFTLDKF